MVTFFRALLDRFKNLFVTQAALDLEAELISHRAERKAELWRRAQQYEDEGLKGLAQHLRQQADAQTSERPLAEVLATAKHLAIESHTEATPVLAGAAKGIANRSSRRKSR